MWKKWQLSVWPLHLFVVVNLAQELALSHGEEPKTHAGTYLVVAPRVVRPGLPYAVSLNLLKSDESQQIVRVEIRNEQNDTIGFAIDKDIKPGEPRTMKIETLSSDSLLPGSGYKLYVKGETVAGHVLFQNEHRLVFDAKSLSIFVQTDKAMYKPASLVRYRVVVVHPDLTPYKDKITVKVEDPNQNIVRQYIDQDLNIGVYSGEIQLASETPLGDWHIKVQTQSGNKFQKEFTVEKYVLPKFEVTVKPPPFITIQDDLAVLVEAKYTYEKGVGGEARIRLEQPWRGWTVVREKGREKTEGLIERIVSLNNRGRATVLFTNDELRRQRLVTNHGTASIRILATVTEQLTAIQRNATARVSVYKHDVKLELEKEGDTFKPGLDYNVVLSLKQQDDSPIGSSAPKRVHVSIFYTFPYLPADRDSQREEKRERLVSVQDGPLLVTLHPPLNASAVRIECRYDRLGKDNFTNAQIFSSLYVNAAKSPSNSFLQLLIEQQDDSPPDTVSFSVKSTQPLDFITVQVMGRGSMLLSRDIGMNGQKTVTGQLETRHEMAPKARLVAYAVLASSKEILVDAADFRVEGLFKNPVSVSMNKESAQPGQRLIFTVKADPDSLVCLLAVDQSVLLLKGGNDITPSLIEQDIRQYDTTGFRPWEGPWERSKRSIWHPWWGIGGKDAASVFQNAGLIVLTDAYLYSEPILPNRRYFPVFAELDNVGLEGPFAVAMPLPAAPPPPSQPGTPSQRQSVRVRSQFPRTWLWSEPRTDANGEAIYEATVPDTITSWITSVFAVNELSGLGVAPSTAKLRVFRPFFIRLNLPYSVKRGEQFALQVLIFNYLENPVNVRVILEQEEDSGYELVERDGSVVQDKKDKQYNEREVTVAGRGAPAAVYFPIVPVSIGQLKLAVRALSDQAVDAVERFLKVEPEGYRVERNAPVVIDLSTDELNSFTRTIELDFPPDAIEGSENAKVEIIGDIMGPVLANIENLVRMPYGCGEQNMVNFVPNIVVMRYLKAVQRDNAQLENKAIKYMEAGYQRQLIYRRDDNSFSAFGQSDAAGSTWLTAFVVKSFKQAEQLIFIDGKIVEKGLEWLTRSRQLENGAWVERGEVHHKALQGGSADALTAYVLVALLENGVRNDKAQHYLETRLSQIAHQPYQLAVVTYALHLADSSKKDEALQMLEQHRISKDGLVHWTDKVDEKRYLHGARAVDVETTAYALLTYMAREDTGTALGLVRWLSSQRNANGGFSSTQDTVLALQALAAYAEKAYLPQFQMTVNVSNGHDRHVFTVGPENAMLLQSFQMRNLNDAVELWATGSGVTFAQVQWNYHRKQLTDDAAFFCTQRVSEVGAGKRLQLALCCNYTQPGNSNMAVAQIDALTGYRLDTDQADQLTRIPQVQRVEAVNDQTALNIYFNPIGSSPVCLSLYSDMVYQVAEQKPANVKLYDYYDPEKEVKMRYSGKRRKSLLESCGVEQCWPNEQLAARALPATGESSRNRRELMKCDDQSSLCEQFKKMGGCVRSYRHSAMVKKTRNGSCRLTCRFC